LTNLTGQQANPAALVLVRGLGSGTTSAANLLGEKMTTFNTDGADGVARNFGQGLTTSLLDRVKPEGGFHARE